MSEKELKNTVKSKEYIFSLFTYKLYAELYFAWSKDCKETFSADSAKYFRDELLLRNNKDLKTFNFRSMRVGENFLLGFLGNLGPGAIRKVDLSDNMISDKCMHNIKSLISAKGVEYLNLASNQISTEGLKIIQNEVIASKTLKYLNLGIIERSFRRNNFNGEGGMILARILLNNTSIETLILQDNELGEDSGDKIGASLIQNKTLRHLVIADNKIKNKGARSIIENGSHLVSINLANNDISPEVCYTLKTLIVNSTYLKDVIWDGNVIGLKGINYIVEGLRESKKIRMLSLKNTSIGVSGMQNLAEGLFGNNSIEILDIGSNSISYESFKEICNSLNSNKIKCLKCKNNLLGDESMKYFADTILSQGTTSCLTAFDFSSCKIYDQGLIYVLNKLTNNDKITWINLRENFFSHEIDFVILNFLEKNSHITHLDLKKNRFSFQCLQKVDKIIKRNRKIQNDKEQNRLLVELYSLKYENTKLNELKDTLKSIENDNEKLKLNRKDLRQDYENFKTECEGKIFKTKEIIEKNMHILHLREKELKEKKEELENKKKENKERIEMMNKQFEELIDKKKRMVEENENLKKMLVKIEEDFVKEINKLNDEIDVNKKKEMEFMKEIKHIREENAKIDKQIKEKQKEKE